MVTESNGSTGGARRTDGPTRRDVVKGAVWSLPVVAVAVATPLAAASTTPLACPLEVLPAVVNAQLDPSDWHVFNARSWWTIGSQYFGIDTSLVDPAVYGSTYQFTLLGGTQIMMSNGGGGTAPWYGVGSVFTGTVGTVTPLPAVDQTIGNINVLVVPDVYDPNSNVDVSFDAADAYTPQTVQFTAELTFTSPTTGETINCIHTFTFNITGTFTGGLVVNGHGHLQLTGTISTP